MKLVAGRATEDSRIAVIGPLVGDRECNWLSVWWEPTEEDYTNKARTRFRGGEGGFPELSSSFIPEGSVVYAALSSVIGEMLDMTQGLKERGLRYEAPGWKEKGRKGAGEEEKKERKSWWKSFFRRSRVGHSRNGVVYAQVDREFVAYAFKNYGSWMIDTWTFLVSQKPLADWARHLSLVSRKRLITKEILTRIDLVLSNRWEHGFELVSTNLSYDRLLEMAKEACAKLQWQFEIRAT